jgi:LytS/YehU family sensor histidine kinase
MLFTFIRYREKQIKKMQQLQNEKMQFRFEVLRNQVNPHFLFNSFNTLISTIEEDPKMAVEYTEQLSDFFRHIVSYRDKDTILLAEELELLNTYFFLQQKRYGDALQMQINISEMQKSLFQIPPLTLQLLVENAIKHNAVSKDSPLLIEIDFVEPDMLTIKNLKNKRVILQSGAGLGLQNIQSRFMLLTKRSVIIEDTVNYFLVKLPLASNGRI